MSEVTHVIVARHGQAEYGHADDAHALSDHGGWLTQTGREQAAALAERLRGEGLTRVLTSPMGRAVETGQIVAEALHLPAAVVDGVQEFAVGELVGRPLSAADEHFQRWLALDLDHRIPGGESAADVIERMHRNMAGILENHPGETVLLVSHGGAMVLALSRLVDDPGFELTSPPMVANCATVHLVHDGDAWHLSQPWPAHQLDADSLRAGQPR